MKMNYKFFAEEIPYSVIQDVQEYEGPTSSEEIQNPNWTQNNLKVLSVSTLPLPPPTHPFSLHKTAASQFLFGFVHEKERAEWRRRLQNRVAIWNAQNAADRCQKVISLSTVETLSATGRRENAQTVKREWKQENEFDFSVNFLSISFSRLF